MFPFTARYSLPVSALFLLAACSGGDGQPNSLLNPGNPPTGQLATISEQNAPTVAGVAARQIFDESVLSTLTNTGIPVAGSGPAAASEMLSLSGGSLAPGLAAAQMTPTDCQVSGTVDVTFSVSSAQTVTPGDEFSFDFDACDDGAGATVTGGLIMTVTDFSGDPNSDAFLLGVSLQLIAFSVTENGMTSEADGSLALTIDSTRPPITSISVSSSSLTVSNGNLTETVSNLSITIVEDQSMFPTATSVETSFRLSSSRLDGDIVVGTSVALERSGDEFPYSGEITISGDADASITIIPLDAGSVRLDVDLDGAGAPDVTIDTTWAEIMAAADAA